MGRTCRRGRDEKKKRQQRLTRLPCRSATSPLNLHAMPKVGPLFISRLRQCSCLSSVAAIEFFFLPFSSRRHSPIKTGLRRHWPRRRPRSRSYRPRPTQRTLDAGQGPRTKGSDQMGNEAIMSCAIVTGHVLIVVNHFTQVNGSWRLVNTQKTTKKSTKKDSKKDTKKAPAAKKAVATKKK